MSYLMCVPWYCLRFWLRGTVLRALQVGLLVSVRSCFSTACGLIAELVKQGHRKNSSAFFCMCTTTKSSCSRGLNELWNHKKILKFTRLSTLCHETKTPARRVLFLLDNHSTNKHGTKTSFKGIFLCSRHAAEHLRSHSLNLVTNQKKYFSQML